MNKLLEKSRGEYAEESRRIVAKYGITEEWLIRELIRAEHELAECDGCTGEPCRKKSRKYWQPVIKRDSCGKWYTPTARCVFGELRALKKMCGRAQIPTKYMDKTFDDYSESADNKRAIQLAKWFVKEQPVKSLYLYGACGTVKTFLAAIIAREFIRNFKQIIFGDVPTLLDDIKRTFDGAGNAQEVLDRYCNSDLLILDDMGAGQVTEWSVGQLYSIINTRYNESKPLIITSNYDLEGLQKRLAIRDNYSASRIISRLNEMCIQGFLGTNDRRK